MTASPDTSFGRRGRETRASAALPGRPKGQGPVYLAGLLGLGGFFLAAAPGESTRVRHFREGKLAHSCF